MPTYRKLHTKILDSYDFAEMPDDFTRVFWLLLIVVVDSAGRAIDNPAWLRSRMFPLRSDVDFSQIESSLAWLAQREMIVRYQVDGRGYFYVSKFMSYQSGTDREARSTLPAPHEQVMSNSGVDHDEVKPPVVVVVNDSVSEDVGVKPTVFEVYENEIGIISKTVSEELTLAETEYPHGWIVDAIKEAAKCNKRNWKYVLGILKNWKIEGKQTFHGPNGSNGQSNKPRILIGPLGQKELDQ